MTNATACPDFFIGWHDSITEVEAAEWNALFRGSVEDWFFYKAIEDAPPRGVKTGAMTLRDRSGQLVLGAPTFELDYRLETSLQGRLRTLVDRLNSRYPGATSLRVVGLGSPMSDNLSLGTSQSVPAATRAAAFDAMLESLMAAGKARRGNIVAVKSITVDDDKAFQSGLDAHGFGRVTSVPVVMLPLPYSSLADYFDALPRKTGAYLQRKYRTVSQLTIEYRTSIEELKGRIVELYEATLAQSNADYGDFDRLPPELFSRFLEHLGNRAKLMLCWQGETLVSFQMFLVGADRVIAYKIGMKYPEAREFNLYFINWIEMIKFAIDHKIPQIEMGATTYASKLLFGGSIERRLLRFRFRRPISNAVLHPLTGMFDFERNDAELKELIAQGKISPFTP